MLPGIGGVIPGATDTSSRGSHERKVTLKLWADEKHDTKTRIELTSAIYRGVRSSRERSTLTSRS